MVKPLSFKGDKKVKKRKRTRDEDADGDGPATKDLKAAQHQDDDDESWVSADSVSDVSGPVIFVLPTKPPTCLACDANGKVYASPLENMVDESHLPFVHPQVGPAAAALDIDDVVLADDVLGGCYPRGAAGKAAKTETALPTFGAIPDGLRERQDIFCVFPNALVFLEADWFQVIGFEPVAADRTVEHMAVFVDSSAAGPESADARKALSTVLFEVNDQDVPILERLQRGRRSPAADRNHLLPSWDQVTARFQVLVADALTGNP